MVKNQVSYRGLTSVRCQRTKFRRHAEGWRTKFPTEGSQVLRANVQNSVAMQKGEESSFLPRAHKC
jgi:hypothetical protein